MATAGNKHANLGKCNAGTYLKAQKRQHQKRLGAVAARLAAEAERPKLLLHQVEWHVAAALAPPPPPVSSNSNL